MLVDVDCLRRNGNKLTSDLVAYSGPKAPAIPIQTRHQFRFDSATDTD